MFQFDSHEPSAGRYRTPAPGLSRILGSTEEALSSAIGGLLHGPEVLTRARGLVRCGHKRHRHDRRKLGRSVGVNGKIEAPFCA